MKHFIYIVNSFSSLTTLLCGQVKYAVFFGRWRSQNIFRAKAAQLPLEKLARTPMLRTVDDVNRRQSCVRLFLPHSPFVVSLCKARILRNSVCELVRLSVWLYRNGLKLKKMSKIWRSGGLWPSSWTGTAYDGAELLVISSTTK